MQTAVYVPAKTAYTEMAGVWEASVRATHHFLNEAYIQRIKLMLFDIFDALQLFCIANDEKIAGIMGLSDDKVEMLFVLPEYCGRGIGRQLMEYAMHEKGIKKVDVNEQNEAATAFYKHLGYRVTGRTETDPLGKPHPILAMEL